MKFRYIKSLIRIFNYKIKNSQNYLLITETTKNFIVLYRFNVKVGNFVELVTIAIYLFIHKRLQN